MSQGDMDTCYGRGGMPVFVIRDERLNCEVVCRLRHCNFGSARIWCRVSTTDQPNDPEHAPSRPLDPGELLPLRTCSPTFDATFAVDVWRRPDLHMLATAISTAARMVLLRFLAP